MLSDPVKGLDGYTGRQGSDDNFLMAVGILRAGFLVDKITRGNSQE